MTIETSAAAAPAVVPATLTPLPIGEAKVGLPVVLLQGDETGATRGKIVTNKDGWLGVRFDDGVTRMVRAKAIARDSSPVIQFRSKEAQAPAVAQMPTGGARKSGQAAKVAAAKVVKPAKPAKVAKVAKPKAEPKTGQPCLCACGEMANPGRAFRQGHDARFHGWMRRLADERMKPAEVPAAALKLMNLNKDGVPTTDYDGSPWKL